MRTPSLLAITGILALMGGAISQAPLTLGFEDIPVGLSVDAGNTHPGIHMPFALVETTPRPHSGSHVARVTQKDASGRIALEMVFDSPQTSVTFFAGSDPGSAMLNGSAEALDENDRHVAEEGPKRLEPGTVSTAFALRATSPSIRRVRVLMMIYSPPSMMALPVSSAPVSVDDITYQPPPPAIDTPIVTLRIPYVVGQTLDSAQAILTGLNLRLGTVQKIVAKDSNNVVIQQRPDSGQAANPGDSVSLDVDSVPPVPINPVKPPLIELFVPNGGGKTNPFLWLIIAASLAVMAGAGTYVVKSRAHLNAIQTVPHLDMGQQRWAPANYTDISGDQGEPLTDRAIDEELARRGISFNVVRDPGSQRLRFRESQPGVDGDKNV